MIEIINMEKPNNSFMLSSVFFICYLNIHLLQMKLKTRSPKYNKYKSISRTWQNYAAYFKEINICRDQVLAISVFCENWFLRLWQFLRKSIRICLSKISIFLHSAKINPQKILQLLKIAGRYVPYTRPVSNFVKAVFKYTKFLYA